ncbi:MAG: methionyl-tRNA formyltransferase [Anaerolineales bacterium]|nr:methionyl-tRNA formyltransferase [Anaerolineales bacterium]
MPTRIVFMGSPDFALPILRTLAESYQVVGVVTQPDRPAGRGQRLTPPPVKVFAAQLDLPLIQPRRLREQGVLEQLRQWRPEVIVVAAFGQILRQEVLDLPLRGCVNVHASLLPRWRGAAPIPASILHGDAQTGVSIMRMDAGIDTGPLYCQRVIPIASQDTTATLTARLAQEGAALLGKSLPGILAGELQPIPQEEAGATYAGMLKKEDSPLDFTLPAEALARRARAFNPWPGAYTLWRGGRLIVLNAHSTGRGLPPGSAPGRGVIVGGLPGIQTTDGVLVLDEVKPASKKPISGRAFLAGARGWEDGILPG